MAGKMVEMTFAIGAALAGSFSGAFGKAGQALGELQKQTSSLQKVSGQIGAYQKMQGAVQQGAEKLNAARMRVKELGVQMKATGTPTAALKKQFTAANQEAHRLEVALGNQRKKLGELRTELTGAGVDTKHLTSEQARLAAQSQRLAEAQTKLQNSRAALQATREKLSWGNVKGDLMKAAGIGLSLGAPVMQAAEFEHAAARLNAVAFSGGGRNAEEDAKAFKALQAQARQLGRDTQFTAVQAAQSQENLARAGFNANEIISAMPGLLDMAAAEGMDLANAADIMASSLRGFGLEASDAARVSNILAQTSAASNSSITGLGDSMKYVAPVAKGLGVSVEETSAMLGIMANAGIKGSQGGTALRAAFLRLSKEPKAVANALAELGIKSRDAKGNMRELPELMQALSARMKNMGSADKMKYLSNIFGSEAASGMLAVMEASVDGSLQQLTRLNRESSGQLQAMSKHTGISIEELRAGMEKADKYARALGISFGDLSVYTSMLAQSGIKGADADQKLTQAFSKMKDKPKDVQKALKSYGIALLDDKGKMRDFNAILTDLNNAMKDMKPPDQLKELTKIFGKDGAQAIQTLMQGMSNGLYDQYSEVAKSATGVSKEMADKVLATFWGQKELAKSAISDLMITIGDVLLPTVEKVVKTFAEWTASLGKLASDYPNVTKAIVGTIGAIAALSVGLTTLKLVWLGIKLPFLIGKVAKETAEVSEKAGLLTKVWGKLSSGVKGIGNASIWSAAKTKVLMVATKSWNAVMKAGRGLLNVGKLVLYGAKSAVVAVAKGAWTAAEWLWVAAMKAGSGLLDVGRLVLYGAKTIAVSLATKAWSITQGLLNIALKPFTGLLNLGKLALYYTKQIAISVATKAWTAAQWLWNAAMNANPIGLIIIAIAGLVAAGYYLYKNWDKVKALWGQTWDWLSAKASSVVESVKNVIASIKGWASKYFKLDFSGMWEGLKSALGSVKDTVFNFISAVKSLFTLDFSGMWNSLVAAGESLKGVFRGIGEAVMSLFNVDASRVIEGAKAAFNGVLEFVSGIGKTIAGIFTFDFSGISEGFMKFCNGAKNALLGVGESIAGLFNIDFSGTWDGFMSGFDSACSYISGKIGELTSWVGNGLSSAWNWTKGLFGYGEDTGTQEQAQDQAKLKAQVQDITVLNKMSEGFSQRVAEMTAAWQPFKASLGEGFEQIYTVMQGIADRIRGVTIPAIHELTTALSQIATEVSSIVQAGGLEVEVRTPATQAAQSYSRTAGSTWGGRRRAKGGIITQPEIALIGEAGREAVIPLENKTRGIPLWKAAGEEMGLLFGNSTTNNDNRNNSVMFSPTYNITVNGGEAGIEEKFRQIIEDVMLDFQDRMQRTSFE